MPRGMHYKRGAVRIVDPKEAMTRLERHRAKRSVISHKVVKRSADVPTVTSTASIAINTTVTDVRQTGTKTFTVFSSHTIYQTLPPATVQGRVVTRTITAPTPTDTVSTAVWRNTVVTSTLSVMWTLTETVTPSALAASCRAEGGHFGTVTSGGSGGNGRNGGNGGYDGNGGDGGYDGNGGNGGNRGYGQYGGY
jgi:uncharacterized membrane protein YgcG